MMCMVRISEPLPLALRTFLELCWSSGGVTAHSGMVTLVFGAILSHMSPGSGSRACVPAMAVSAFAFCCPQAANPPWALLRGVKTLRCCCLVLGFPCWKREQALAFPRARLQLRTRARFPWLLPRNSDAEAATSIPHPGCCPMDGICRPHSGFWELRNPHSGAWLSYGTTQMPQGELPFPPCRYFFYYYHFGYFLRGSCS